MADGEDEERRDSSASSSSSSSSSLQAPNFLKPKGGGVTHHQLSKFQELRRRRLQIKSKSKIKRNKKGASATGQSQIKHHPNTSDKVNEAERSDVAFGENSSHVHQHHTKTTVPSKKLQKLHWGLDTKEPWERKANM